MNRFFSLELVECHLIHHSNQQSAIPLRYTGPCSEREGLFFFHWLCLWSWLIHKACQNLPSRVDTWTSLCRAPEPCWIQSGTHLYRRNAQNQSVWVPYVRNWWSSRYLEGDTWLAQLFWRGRDRIGLQLVEESSQWCQDQLSHSLGCSNCCCRGHSPHR